MNMIWHRWDVKDLVLVAFSVAAITLGLWPSMPQRQMILCSAPDGNTRSFSLPIDDSRLARIRREIDRRRTPPPVRAVVLAKWRIDLAAHYLRRGDVAATRKLAREMPAPESAAPESATPESATPESATPESATPESAAPESAQPTQHLTSHPLPADIVPASFNADAVAVASSPTAVERGEADFWKTVAEDSQQALVAAERAIAAQLAHAAPSPVTLGAITKGGLGIEGWITAAILGMLAACLFAEWAYRSPSIGFTQVTEQRDRELGTELRIEIPTDWIRIHQPFAVQLRRGTMTGLVATAFVVTILSN